RADRGRGGDAEDDAQQAAEDALRGRLPDDLPQHQPLRPAHRLQRPDLADALADRREREQRGEQERRQRGEDRERDAEPVREVRRVDERAADLVGDLLLARDLRVRVLRLDRLLHGGDRVAVLRANEHDVREAGLRRELLQPGDGDVDVGALAAERRPDETDDRELRAVEFERRADAELLAARVAGRQQRLVAAGLGEGTALGDQRRADDARAPAGRGGPAAGAGGAGAPPADRFARALEFRRGGVAELLDRLLRRHARAAEVADRGRQPLLRRAGPKEEAAAPPPPGEAALPAGAA